MPRQSLDLLESPETDQRCGVETVGRIPSAPAPWELLKARILTIVGEDDGLIKRPIHPLGFYWGIPGAWHWWALRSRLGGRVHAGEVRRAVDELLADGVLLEVWVAPVGRRDPAHLLMLNGVSLRRPVVKARGREDVLRKQSWYRW